MTNEHGRLRLESQVKFAVTFAVILTFSCKSLLAYQAKNEVDAQADPLKVHFADESFELDLTAETSKPLWRILNCEVEFSEDQLELVAGNGFVQTTSRFRDFELEFEWKPLQDEKWDSGIFIRCDAPSGENSWPERYQINLKQGEEGKLIGTSLEHGAKWIQENQWNHFRLQAMETKVTLWINEHVVWTKADFEDRAGFIGIQSEVPLGGRFQFRNFKIREFGKLDMTKVSKQNYWQEITNADPTSIKTWNIEKNEVSCSGEPGGWLRWNHQVSDFNLKLDYLLQAGGNSGVYIRVPEDGNHHGPGAGIEVQILDDSADKYADLKAYQYSGSLYAIHPAKFGASRKSGSWNSLEIDCHDHEYSIVLNGQVIVQADRSLGEKLTERQLAGFLGLQNHNETVRFRNIRIGGSLAETRNSSPEQ